MATTEVAQWIQRLDAMTPDAIAELFRAENVTGLAGSTARCPIANFLRSKGAASHVAVYGGYIEWTELTVGPDASPRIEHGCVYTLRGIGGFVFAFDAGQYPDLKAESKSLPDYDVVSALEKLYQNSTKSVNGLTMAAASA